MDASGVFLTVIVILAVSAYPSVVESTKTRSCKGARQGRLESVDILACEQPPCLLKKNTAPSIEIKFVPEDTVSQVKNHVLARIAGLPIPFVGVDGTTACGMLFQEDGETPAGCPLSAGTPYVYKNSFDILPFYPTVSPMVHWALQDASTGKDIVCFEIQAKIVE